MNLRLLADVDLLVTVKSLVKSERSTLTNILWHLAEIQRRKLFSPRFSSLFTYATVELGYSEDEAGRRIAAMRLLVELPEIEPKVASGELTLTKLTMAQTFFRAESAVLREKKSTSRIDRETKLELIEMVSRQSTREAARSFANVSSAPEKLRPEITRQVSDGASEIRLTVKNSTLAKFSRLKGLLAHKYPHLTTADLLELVCDLALEEMSPAKNLKKKRKTVERSAAEAQPANTSVLKKEERGLTPKSSIVPPAAPQVRRPGASLRRDVWRRAHSKCEKCGSAHALEIDHVMPFALGGLTTSENLRLLCRSCNQRESILVFGSR